MRTYCFIAGKLAGSFDAEAKPVIGDEIVFKTTHRHVHLPSGTIVKFRVSEKFPPIAEDGFVSVEASQWEVLKDARY
jgi:hypothetical protein